MALKKQNRMIIFLFLFTVLIVGVIAIRSSQFMGFFDAQFGAGNPNVSRFEKAAGALAEFSQESMGDPVNGQVKVSNPQDIETRKNLIEVMRLLSECLLVPLSLPEDLPPNAETILSQLQKSWGSYEVNDQWINWYFHLKDGSEKRLKLEVNETEAGIKGRELHYYAVDKEGLPILVPLENVASHNPSDEAIMGILKDGEIFNKEKSSTVKYEQGANLEYLEKNGELAAIEVHLAEKIFRCSNMKAVKDSCLCTK